MVKEPEQVTSHNVPVVCAYCFAPIVWEEYEYLQWRTVQTCNCPDELCELGQFDPNQDDPLLTQEAGWSDIDWDVSA